MAEPFGLAPGGLTGWAEEPYDTGPLDAHAARTAAARATRRAVIPPEGRQEGLTTKAIEALNRLHPYSVIKGLGHLADETAYNLDHWQENNLAGNTDLYDNGAAIGLALTLGRLGRGTQVAPAARAPLPHAEMRARAAPAVEPAAAPAESNALTLNQGQKPSWYSGLLAGRREATPARMVDRNVRPSWEMEPTPVPSARLEEAYQRGDLPPLNPPAPPRAALPAADIAPRAPEFLNQREPAQPQLPTPSPMDAKPQVPPPPTAEPLTFAPPMRDLTATDAIAQRMREIGPSADAQAPQGIRAHHGSPHDFERFSMGSVGTGEGAQTFGHGLYFAENPSVAQSYRRQLSDRHTVELDGSRITPRPGTADDVAASYLADGHKINARDPYRYALDDLAEDRISGGLSWLDRRKLNAAESTLKDWQAKGGQYKPGGHTYEVNINAKPERFLDWDKPLAQHAPEVRDILHRVGRNPDTAISRVTDNMSGSEFYNALANRDKVAATKALRDAGIPGIQYLDRGSRAAGEGTRNYVVFDDKLIDVLKKYGIPGVLGTSAFGSLAPGDKP